MARLEKGIVGSDEVVIIIGDGDVKPEFEIREGGRVIVADVCSVQGPSVRGVEQARPIAGLIKQSMAEKCASPMKVLLGKGAREATHQQPFDEEVNCCRPGCESMARIAFVCFEDDSDDTLVCDLHKNDLAGEGMWPHDAVAVAIYFCKTCLTPRAIFNQG